MCRDGSPMEGEGQLCFNANIATLEASRCVAVNIMLL